MAIWQLDFNLVPKEKKDFSDEFIIDEASLDILSQTIPKTTSWCDELIMFGNIDDTCVSLYYHNLIIDDISVRIHVGSITKKQICSIIEFANNNHLQIEYNEQYIPISWENIICMIKESRALEFIKDPEKFFDNISTE